MIVPTGMFRSGRTFPGLMLAVFEEMTVSPRVSTIFEPAVATEESSDHTQGRHNTILRNNKLNALDTQIKGGSESSSSSSPVGVQTPPKCGSQSSTVALCGGLGEWAYLRSHMEALPIALSFSLTCLDRRFHPETLLSVILGLARGGCGAWWSSLGGAGRNAARWCVWR